MDIHQLKEYIEDKNVPSFMVWQLQDNSSRVIAEQYLHRISTDKNLSLKIIESYSQIIDTGFAENTDLYIMNIDKAIDIQPRDNLVILCNKTSYKDAVYIPKLEKWQFSDYLKEKLPGMNPADIEWLMTQYETTYDRVTGINYNRLINDLDKVSIFPPSMQSSVFNQLYESGEYSTISNLTIFDLTSALVHRNSAEALQVLKVFDYIDSQPHVWLLSILLNNFKNIIGIQLGNLTAEELEISDKQYYVVKKFNCGNYTRDELVKIYDILTKGEYLYKFGGLGTELLADYLICNILGI